MDESKFGAILGSLRMNRCIADGPPVHRMADSCSLVMILLVLDIILEYMNLMIDY